MNKQLINSLLCLSIAIGLGACTKKKEEAITSDDAADAFAETMEYKSGGYAEAVEISANYVYAFGGGTGNFNPLECGQQHDTTITRSITGSITASFTHHCNYVMNCENGVPVSITGTGTHNGNYDGPRINSSTNGTRNWIITGLGNSSANYIYNGSLARSGVHTSKVRKKNTFTTSVNIATTNLLVAKTTRKIVSGTSTVNITCSSSSGKEYDFSGYVTFNGDDTATLVLDGNTYTITF